MFRGSSSLLVQPQDMVACVNTSENSAPIVTPEERLAFLKRQGWREDLSAAEQQKIEASWTDDEIRMAIDLNLA